MKLFLIRHGETVDNVAGLYAGVRDSALTNHGVEQTLRLAEHFTASGIRLTHIFSSPLSRAWKTAEALRVAQTKTRSGKDGDNDTINIVQVPDLIEQNFGFYEGKAFSARSNPKNTVRQEGHEDVESRESLETRAETFLDEHLMPLYSAEQEPYDHFVAIVSHGMLLSHLWRRLLRRLPKKSLTIAPGIMAARDNLVLEHLGGWGNTGYLELLLEPPSRDKTVVSELEPAPASEVKHDDGSASTRPMPSREFTNSTEPVPHGFAPSQTLVGWSTTVIAVDSKQHLIGLKRQRGGIGRLAHDENQKKLDGFFKRQKTG